MVTVFQSKILNRKIRTITQQYYCGLYIASYVEGSKIPIQTGSKKDELRFHKDLRKRLEKNGDILVVEESSAISEKRKVTYENGNAFEDTCAGMEDEVEVRGASEKG